MSARKMLADSTQEDPKTKKRKKDAMKTATKGKKTAKKRKSEEPEDPELMDLNVELLPISGYIRNPDEMIEHMFRSVKGATLSGMLANILKNVPLDELKSLCLEELEVMSKKRVKRILDGEDPDEISSSDSDDELDTSEEEQQEEEEVELEEGDEEGGETEENVEVEDVEQGEADRESLIDISEDEEMYEDVTADSASQRDSQDAMDDVSSAESADDVPEKQQETDNEDSDYLQIQPRPYNPDLEEGEVMSSGDEEDCDPTWRTRGEEEVERRRRESFSEQPGTSGEGARRTRSVSPTPSTSSQASSQSSTSPAGMAPRLASPYIDVQDNIAEKEDDEKSGKKTSADFDTAELEEVRVGEAEIPESGATEHTDKGATDDHAEETPETSRHQMTSDPQNLETEPAQIVISDSDVASDSAKDTTCIPQTSSNQTIADSDHLNQTIQNKHEDITLPIVTEETDTTPPIVTQGSSTEDASKHHLIEVKIEPVDNLTEQEVETETHPDLQTEPNADQHSRKDPQTVSVNDQNIKQETTSPELNFVDEMDNDNVLVEKSEEITDHATELEDNGSCPSPDDIFAAMNRISEQSMETDNETSLCERSNYSGITEDDDHVPSDTIDDKTEETLDSSDPQRTVVTQDQTDNVSSISHFHRRIKVSRPHLRTAKDRVGSPDSDGAKITDTPSCNDARRVMFDDSKNKVIRLSTPGMELAKAKAKTKTKIKTSDSDFQALVSNRPSTSASSGSKGGILRAGPSSQATETTSAVNEDILVVSEDVSEFENPKKVQNPKQDPEKEPESGDLCQNRLELLELEMRARAIKAMLKVAKD